MGSVVFESELSLGDVSIDDHDLIQFQRGKIIAEDGNETDREIGRCTGYVYEVGRAFNEEENLFVEADALTVDAFNYIKVALTKHLTVKRGVAAATGVPAGSILSRMLAINTVEVLPAFRGKGLGLEAAASMIKAFGCEVAILKVAPLQRIWDNSPPDPQWHGKMSLPTYSPERDRKLMAHWGKLGFERIGKTSLWRKQ